jgi:hypothetical protein
VIIFISILAVMPSVSIAKVNCIRLTGEHTADVTDLERFRQFPAWRDKKGNDLALAVWKYLCGYETGLYHFNEILERSDTFDEYATVRDPLKILNVYNMGYCGIFGPVLDGVSRALVLNRDVRSVLNCGIIAQRNSGMMMHGITWI